MADDEEQEVSWQDSELADSSRGVAASSPRGAWAAVGVVGSALLAVLLWSLIASGDDEGDRGDPASGDASPATTTTELAATTSALEATTTTRQRSTTTAFVQPDNIEVPVHPAGHRWNAELVLAIPDAFVTIDLDTGEVDELDWTRPAFVRALRSDESGNLAAWVNNTVQHYVDGEVTSIASPGGISGMWPVDGDILVGDTGDEPKIRNGAGDVLFEFDSYLEYPLNVGSRLVVSLPDGWVVVDTFSGELLSYHRGRLKAATDSHAIWIECDGLDCSTKWAPLSDLDSARQVVLPDDVNQSEMSLAPDGRHVLIESYVGPCSSEVWSVIDGEMASEFDCGALPNVAWSSDGEAIFMPKEPILNDRLEVEVVLVGGGEVATITLPIQRAVFTRSQIEGIAFRPRPS